MKDAQGDQLLDVDIGMKKSTLKQSACTSTLGSSAIALIHWLFYDNLHIYRHYATPGMMLDLLASTERSTPALNLHIIPLKLLHITIYTSMCDILSSRLYYQSNQRFNNLCSCQHRGLAGIVINRGNFNCKKSSANNVVH